MCLVESDVNGTDSSFEYLLPKMHMTPRSLRHSHTRNSPTLTHKMLLHTVIILWTQGSIRSLPVLSTLHEVRNYFDQQFTARLHLSIGKKIYAIAFVSFTLHLHLGIDKRSIFVACLLFPSPPQPEH